MKIELPLETWTEVFGFVPRSQLEELVPHIEETRGRTLGDRQFVSFIQFFLHKCGEITFGRLHITSSENGNEPIVIVNYKRYDENPLADVPIPENVKNFKSILTNNFDESVVAFLQQFQRNSLLTNVTTISTIILGIRNGFTLHGKMESQEFCLFTITTRMIVHFLISSNTSKKDFLEANQAVSFFVKLERVCRLICVQSLTLENSRTREKLVIKGANGYYDPVMILRYPMGTNEEEWSEEMGQCLHIDNRLIEFHFHA